MARSGPQAMWMLRRRIARLSAPMLADEQRVLELCGSWGMWEYLYTACCLPRDAIYFALRLLIDVRWERGKDDPDHSITASKPWRAIFLYPMFIVSI